MVIFIKFMTEKKTYAFEDIKDHDREDDLWVAVFDKVYDVTEFAKEHPGGKKVLLELGGSNGTLDFEDQGHDDFHLGKMEKFLVGKYDDSKDPSDMVSKGDSNPATSSSQIIWVLLFLLAVGLLGKFMLGD